MVQKNIRTPDISPVSQLPSATVRAAIIARIFTFSLHDRQQGILYGHLLQIGCIVYNNLLYLFL
jgi:hypothetical protein